jgi:hypothetical protein
MRSYFALLFVSLAVASFLGGTVHGFFPDETRTRSVLWVLTLFAIGFAAYACWNIAASLLLLKKSKTYIRVIFASLLLVYMFVVLFLSQDFAVAVFFYLPSTIFLFIGVLLYSLSAKQERLFFAVVGLLMTFLAAALQQLEVSLHPVYFTYNAVYHVVQAVALWLLFHGIGDLVTHPNFS